jgi:hypothetical protein
MRTRNSERTAENSERTAGVSAVFIASRNQNSRVSAEMQRLLAANFSENSGRAAAPHPGASVQTLTMAQAREICFREPDREMRRLFVVAPADDFAAMIDPG